MLSEEGLEKNKSFKPFSSLSAETRFGVTVFCIHLYVLAIIMKLQIIKSEGLAHNSYYLSSENEAVVIDPRRDCEIYTQLAKEDCAKIKYILETHRNEDYVVGSLELQNHHRGRNRPQ